ASICDSTSSAPKDSAADFVSRFHATAVFAIARSTRNSPAPMRVIGASSPGNNAGLVNTAVSALFISIALIFSGERFGKACRISAAAPATIGDAPEVPLKAVSPVHVPTSADTEPPGAPISGLMLCPLIDGPRDELLAMLPTSGIAAAGENETLTTCPPVSCVLMLVDSNGWITSVGAKWVPPPNENEMASPGATSPIRTPMAPAATARSTFRLTEQAPRSISTIFPVGKGLGYGSAGLPGLMLSAGQPRPMKATSPVTPAPTGAQSTVAVFLYMPAIAAGVFTTSAIACALGTCVCATLITPGAIDGELTMYGLLAPLPAAAPTITPILTALVEASARSSSI